MELRIAPKMTTMQKLEILTDAAKYDVACTSSGIDRSGDGTGMGNTKLAGICHSFSSDGRCISLLKILFTNECIFDCRYCRAVFKLWYFNQPKLYDGADLPGRRSAAYAISFSGIYPCKSDPGRRRRAGASDRAVCRPYEH